MKTIKFSQLFLGTWETLWGHFLGSVRAFFLYDFLEYFYSRYSQVRRSLVLSGFFWAMMQAIRDYLVQLTAQSIYNQLFIFLISILNFFKASFLPKDVLNYTRNEQIGLGIILISK